MFNSKIEPQPGTLKLILTYLKPYKFMIVGVVFSLFITSASVLGISSALRYLIDFGLVKGEIFLLNKALLYLLSIISILAIFTAVRFFLITMVGEKVVTDLRRDIYRHILGLSPAFFEKNQTGEILSRITADSTVLLTIIGSSLSVAARNTIMLIGGVFMLASISLKLSSILAILIPIIILPLILTMRRLRNYTRDAQDKIAEITSQCEQTLGAIKTIQAYTREDHEKKIFDNRLKQQLKTANDRITLRAVLTALIIFLVFGGIAFVLWIGGHEVLKGNLSAGELSAFIYTGVVCAGTVMALSDVLGDVQKALGATERIFEFLAIKPDIKESDNPISIAKRSKGNIEFKDVEFGYGDGHKKILSKVSFEIEPGKVTALVGKSGVGKTTIFMLLERFYDIRKGGIFFDGVDIKELRLSELRSRFTYIAQDPIIFSTTAYENILYGNPKATKEEVLEAARQANCLEFIEKMPDGFDTYLGDKGMKLSGGQKQRLVIARAILNNPKILLLDEATSSLDSENEQTVHLALNNLMSNRTTIVIAHRLSTIKKADKIIVLNDGKIAETGTHENLIKKETGIYKRLAKLQFDKN
jgi:ATP-binding cassette, subfamily B, bacterial